MDSETLDTPSYSEVEKEPDNDFPGMSVDLVKKINFKVAFFLLLIGMFIFSDIFMNNVLPESMHEGGMPTSKGTMVQLMLLVMGYIVIDLLVQGEIL